MKTKAEELGITKFPYKEFDGKGNLTYEEWEDGLWWKYEFDDKSNMTNRECSYGDWWNRKFDKEGNTTYLEYHDGIKVHTII